MAFARLFLLFIFAAQMAYSEKDSTNTIMIANLEGLPSAIVNGSVNAITGAYFDTVTDIAFPGSSNLNYDRSYISSTGNMGGICQTWNSNQQAFAQLTNDKTEKECSCTVSLRSDYGAFMLYEGNKYKRENKIHFSMFSGAFESGLTNTGRGGLSAQTNVKNDKYYYDINSNELHFSDGSGMTMTLGGSSKKECYNLMHKRLPSGHQYKYDYYSGHKIMKIEELNMYGGVIGTINVDQPNKKDKFPRIKLKGSDGTEVTYDLVKMTHAHKKNRCFISSVHSNRARPVYYSYEHHKRGPLGKCVRMNEKRRDNGWKEQIFYHKHGDGKFKVSELKSPVGHDQTPITTVKLGYHFSNDERSSGKTYVTNARGYATVYRYENHRITHIERLNKSKGSSSSVEYCWSDQGDLNTQTLRSNLGHCQISREYIYDGRGNVIEDRLFGNFSGDTVLLKDWRIENFKNHPNTELYVKKFEYSDNGMNLLTKEYDERKTVTYQYWCDNSLLAAKLIWSEGKIVSRHFYDYDANSAVKLEIVDNGSTTDMRDLTGVTERYITEFDNHTSYPVGLPKKVVNKYYDSADGQEKTISTKAFQYNNAGRKIEEKVYDGNGTFVCVEKWDYDDFGNLIEHTNPLGEIATFRYDNNDNLIYEAGARPEFYKEYKYDYCDRLVSEEEFHADGTHLKKGYRYDYMGNVLAEIDIYGNETTFEYDFANRLTKVIEPSGVVKQQLEYNCLDVVTSQRDALGNITLKEYNSRGQPQKITFPDGRVERYRYNLDGSLRETQANDGTVTKIKLDYQDREIEKSVYSESGELLFKTSREYNAFHLLSETDAAGNVTYYEYDAQGREIRVTSGSKVTESAYDVLGRKNKVTIYSNEDRSDAIITVYEYDVLNRIIAEIVKDFKENEESKNTYCYDCDGNRTQSSTVGAAGVSTSYKEFNAHGVVTREVDAEGHERYNRIRFDYFDEEGNHVGCTENIDPMGNMTMVVKNVNGRDAAIIKKDAFDKILHKTVLSYDLVGQLIERVDHVYQGEEKVREITKRWEYDNCGRVFSIIDAYGSNDQKQWLCSYNQKGQKISITKSDGTVIHHEYDERGLLSKIKSSNGDIHYTYEYDIMNNPIRIVDEVAKTETQRDVDRYGQVTREKLANGLVLQYTYDTLGRERTVTLHDKSSIEYVYEGGRLQKINRRDNRGAEKYSHKYVEFDERGAVLQVDLAKNAGTIAYDYDLMGRVIAIEAKHWREVIAGFDDSGNLIAKQTTDAIGTEDESFAYDALYQLTSENGHSYLYDSLNNRVKKDDKKNEINDLNQILEDENKSYRYDLNGNMIAIIDDQNKALSLEYDSFDRLVKIYSGNDRFNYQYDANNRRIRKTHQQQDNEGAWQVVALENYIYHGNNEIGATNAEGTITELRLLGKGLGAEIGAAVALELGGNVYVPIHDHNGNVCSLIDADSGNISETYRHTAFGEGTVYDQEGRTKEDSINPWRFSSKRHDKETDFVYFGRRYYCAEIGRWITSDPLGDRDGPNMYAYVKNNPMTHYDLYGLLTEGGLRANAPELSPVQTSVRNLLKPVVVGLRYLGQGIELAAMNILPPSPPRYLAECFGRILQGTASECPESWGKGISNGTVSANSAASGAGAKDSAESGIKAGEGTPKTASKNPDGIVVTGIMNNSKDTESVAHSIAQDGDMKVLSICHESKGFLTDLWYFFLAKIGVDTQAVVNIRNQIQDMYDNCIAEGGIPKFLVTVHSRGAQEFYSAVNKLSSEIKNSLFVNSYGGAKILPDEFGSCNNVVNPGDLVPFLGDLLGVIMNWSRIMFTDQKMSWNPLAAHDVNSTGYAKHRREKTYNFRNRVCNE
ncbi:MAG: RHS repeat-associated core domain-containing protein [Chlamydiota bacterium]|nr:RHS repeat-associated core domain-containing protein [Chlamydiota bacterium]